MIAFPNPASSYAKALARVPDVSIRPKMSTVMPISESIAMTHGKATDEVFMLMHGFTNSPQQFREMGERLHRMGHNVFIPRMPHHGLVDRMNEEMGQLSDTELADYANRALDIATALGDKVTVVGLSTGGVLTAYLSQVRTEIDTAMLIAPSFGLAPVPPPLLPLLRATMTRTSNKFLWWGEEGDMGDTEHAYPRWSTHALLSIISVGAEATRLARKNRPNINQAHLVLNANDKAIHAKTAENFGDSWEKHGVPFTRFAFPVSDDLDHDLIDPSHPKQNIDHVYAKLFSILGLA